MSNNPLVQLASFDQSPWYDNIQRAMIQNGELTRLIDNDGLKGMTSNPAIFQKAMTGSSDYDESLKQHLAENPNQDAKTLFYRLAIEDIQMAADAFIGVYQQSKGKDGYISIEISPDLAADTKASIAEALELVKRIDRPNLMIKVPATLEGLPVIERLTAEGINVNATLLFSVARYLAVNEAYIKGLETRLTEGKVINNIASVASFFVSRVDSAVDAALEDVSENTDHLKSKTAVANAKVAYQGFKTFYASDRFAPLEAAGARPQRLLWASTGIKNPALKETFYVDELIGAKTVSTIPPATFDAFRSEGVVAATLEKGLAQAEETLSQLTALNIDLTAITDELETQGVKLFADAFDQLLSAIQDKRQGLL